MVMDARTAVCGISCDGGFRIPAECTVGGHGSARVTSAAVLLDGQGHVQRRGNVFRAHSWRDSSWFMACRPSPV